MAAARADTAHMEDNTLLSLEGLARLARHVVRRLVERAPKGKDDSFNYRSAQPGIIHARLAAQYWIHQAAGFDRKSAPAFLDGMIEFLIEGMSKRSDAGLVDMTTVLEKIEKTAPSLWFAATTPNGLDSDMMSNSMSGSAGTESPLRSKPGVGNLIQEIVRSPHCKGRVKWPPTLNIRDITIMPERCRLRR